MRSKTQALFFLGLFIFLIGSVSSCADSQRILRLSAPTNAHGATYTASVYTTEICYDEIFGETYSGASPHTCTSGDANKVLGLSSSTNAHAQSPSLSNYLTPVCYGDLECRYTQTTSCTQVGTDYFPVVYLSAEDNAHLSKTAVAGWNAICCKSPSAGTPTTEPCDLTSASWSKTSAYEGETVQLNLEGTNCDGKTISFTIKELDGFLDPDDSVTTNPENIVFSSTTKSGTWTAEWQDDSSFLEENPPEFYFIATVLSGDHPLEEITSSKSDPHLLKVYSCGDGIVSYDYTEQCEGSSNGCVAETCKCNSDEGYNYKTGVGCELVDTTNCGNKVLDSNEKCELKDDGTWGTGCIQDMCTCDATKGFVEASPTSADCVCETGKTLVGGICVSGVSTSGCAQYTTQTECQAFDSNVAKEDIKETRDDGKTCEEIFGRTAPPELCDKKLVDCRCVWEDDKCKAKNDIDLINCLGGDDPDNPYGTCTYDRKSDGDCNVPGTKFISFITEGVFTWIVASDDDDRTPAELNQEFCETIPEESFPCPTTTKLPFFTFWNFIITGLAITFLYGYLILRKNSK